MPIKQLATLALACAILMAAAAHAQIVAFGASNISGWNLPASEAVSAQLRGLLKARGYLVRVVNAGAFGNTTQQMLARMDTDVPDGTTIVILDVSGGLYNDAQNGLSRQAGEADMQQIESRLQARGIHILPVNAAQLPAEYHQADGVHLTAEGQRLTAEQLLPQVMAILGPPSARDEVIVACEADAHRLCADTLGDDARRHACMHAHRAELSKDCLAAIVRNRDAAAPAPPAP
jgi:acyl-CoA thioesterase I